MTAPKWNITLKVSRQKAGLPRKFQFFKMEVDPDEYVLDAVERVWAFHDRSLCYRHACHHSTCGACGMLVNGVEKLTCITPIRFVTRDHGTLTIEPLRNFPVISDLAVDMGGFYRAMDHISFGQVAKLEDACLPFEQDAHSESGKFERLVDCIECGCCISACPAALTSTGYVGPAVLAGLQHSVVQTGDHDLLELANNQDGSWRCHSAFECTAVCPSNVNPGWRIMDLRKRTIVHKFKKLFRRNRQEAAQ